MRADWIKYCEAQAYYRRHSMPLFIYGIVFFPIVFLIGYCTYRNENYMTPTSTPQPEINKDFTLNLSDGKYTYIRHEKGGQKALRYGEAWRDLTGDNLIYFMGCEIESLRQQLSEAVKDKERLEWLVKMNGCYIRQHDLNLWLVGDSDGNVVATGETSRTAIDTAIQQTNKTKE